jgi:hypothetical protein
MDDDLLLRQVQEEVAECAQQRERIKDERERWKGVYEAQDERVQTLLRHYRRAAAVDESRVKVEIEDLTQTVWQYEVARRKINQERNSKQFRLDQTKDLLALRSSFNVQRADTDELLEREYNEENEEVNHLKNAYNQMDRNCITSMRDQGQCWVDLFHRQRTKAEHAFFRHGRRRIRSATPVQGFVRRGRPDGYDPQLSSIMSRGSDDSRELDEYGWRRDMRALGRKSIKERGNHAPETARFN